MRRATGGLLAIALLAACSDDSGSSDGGVGGNVGDTVETTTSAEFGEMVELGDTVFVAVDNFSVELLPDDHEQVSSASRVDVPAIVADLRSENRGTGAEATGTNPVLRTYCADQIPSLEDAPVLGPYTGLAPGNPEWLGADLPAGSSSEASVAVLAPGQQHMGAALPPEHCDDPRLRLEPTTWQGEARSGVEVPFPPEVLSDYRMAYEEYTDLVTGQVDEDDVTVMVVNASGDVARAERMTGRIEQLGYETVDPVNGPETPLVIMYYEANTFDVAEELWESLATEVPDHVRPEWAAVGASDPPESGAATAIVNGEVDLVLILGSNFEEG